MTHWYRWQDVVLLLDCYLKPRARTNAVLGLHVQVKAAPVAGQANAALCALLAEAFEIPKSRAELRQGAGGCRKIIALLKPHRQPAWFVEVSRD